MQVNISVKTNNVIGFTWINNFFIIFTKK